MRVLAYVLVAASSVSAWTPPILRRRSVLQARRLAPLMLKPGIANDITELIGETPMVRLTKVGCLLAAAPSNVMCLYRRRSKPKKTEAALCWLRFSSPLEASRPTHLA